MKKIILVTGGTSGIGLETVKLLTEDRNIQVIACGRSEKRLFEAKKYLGKKSDKIDFILADVSTEEGREKIYNHINTHYKTLYGLVNGAGVMKLGGIEGETLEDWEFSMDVNLNSVFALTKKLLPLLKKNDNASIVNISSIASERAGASASYSVSKAGLDMLTRHLSKELGKYNIRVNAVNPGIVRSNFHFTSEVFDNLDDRDNFLNNAIKDYPLKRIGEPIDIAYMIEFLLLDKSKWVTGTIVKIDGGRLS